MRDDREVRELRDTVVALRVQTTALQLLVLALLPTLDDDQRAALDQRLDLIERMDPHATHFIGAAEVQERLGEWVAMVRGAMHGA